MSSFARWPFTPRGKIRGCPIAGHQKRSGRSGEEENYRPCRESNTSCPTHRQSLYTAELSESDKIVEVTTNAPTYGTRTLSSRRRGGYTMSNPFHSTKLATFSIFLIQSISFFFTISMTILSFPEGSEKHHTQNGCEMTHEGFVARWEWDPS